MLGDFPWYPRHVRRLPCEDITIVAQEVGELAFVFVGSWVPICTVLARLVGSTPTALVSSSGQKAIEEVSLLQSRTAGVDDSPSYGSSDELMTVVASSKCSRSHMKVCEKALPTVMMPFGTGILNLR